MNYLKLLFMLTASCLALYSCGKNDEPVTGLGGKGGNAIMKVSPKHHSEPIDSCMVYIKYNSLDAAAAYDDSAKAIVENGNAVATFSGLKKGKYYFYGEGWDVSINQAVIGGLPYTVEEEKTYDITLPVTEGD